MSTEYLKLTENKAQTAHPGAARRAKFAKSQLEVRMFNVGEGEAILIAFPNRRAWMVVLLEPWSQAVRAPPRLAALAQARLQTSPTLLPRVSPKHVAPPSHHG